MKRTFKILQIVWLIAAILALGAAVESALRKQLPEAGIFLAITFIGALMFMVNKKRAANDHPNTSN